MQNADNIGHGRPFPNPQDAIEQQQGKYADKVAVIPPEQKLPILPLAPQPTPFRITGG